MYKFVHFKADFRVGGESVGSECQKMAINMLKKKFQKKLQIRRFPISTVPV